MGIEVSDFEQVLLQYLFKYGPRNVHWCESLHIILNLAAGFAQNIEDNWLIKNSR